MNPRGALSGRGVLVSRPRAQAAALSDAIRAAGGHPLEFPLIDIEPLADTAAVTAASATLDDAALAVFVSANAVAHALDLILPRRAWPAALPAATVGEQSAQALRARGIARVLVPQQGRFDSEALLALPELSAAALAGRRVLIFRGDGGRELLGDTLRARGATVEHIACYRRVPPRDCAPLCEAVRSDALHALTITSSESLRNLLALPGLDCADALRALPLFAPHARIAEQAREQGFARVIETDPADAGLMAGLTDYFSSPSRDLH
ncbi:uroporphyrinogen-III synthase [Methyloversatilis discipulorum]|uniref:uroporphyrinogen-III synthase n=1 Tax=Methyloversatilis discipulorum TaxID=1119528 RepID=UPI001A37A372|nr:uroporphyrinogen-III synthase [Methyloversatilis discipulorum]MBL8467511.1 uroporphyrinogen-III synthase [Methyloversatilis discipulorum]